MDEEIINRFENIERILKAHSSVFNAIDKSVTAAWDAIEQLQRRSDNDGQWLDMIEKRLEILLRHDKEHKERYIDVMNRIDKNTAVIAALGSDTMRLNEVYYHVFPERLEQDNRLDRQLNALTAKPLPGAEGKNK